MAEPNLIDRLQPCLLDRLTTDRPRDPVDFRHERYVSLQKYRQGVERDLEWLLNAEAHLMPSGTPRKHLDRFRMALGSVLNFGVSTMVGLTAAKPEEIREKVSEAIRRFEPRISPSSLEVHVKKEEGQLTLRIRGVLWANPIPESLDIRSRIDLETGACVMGDASHG